MKIWNYTKTRLVPIRINKYLINWDNFNGSGPEKRFVELIKPYWYPHYTVLNQYRIPSCLLRLDFFCLSLRPPLIIEVSPSSHHGNFNKFFHKNRSGLHQSIKKDMNKRKWAEEYNGFNVLELDNSDLDNFSARYIKDKFDISII